MNRDLVRRIGFIVLGLAAVVVFFAGGPSSSESVIDEALSDARVNEISASGAPQQTVVNGWVARDLLEVVARQEPDGRVPALLLIGILAFLLHAATLPRPGEAADATASTRASPTDAPASPPAWAWTRQPPVTADGQTQEAPARDPAAEQEPSDFPCETCGRRFTTSAGRLRHARSQHPEQQP